MAKRSHTRSNLTNTHRVVAKGNVDSANTPPPPPLPVKEDEDETEQVTTPTEPEPEDKPVEPEQEPEPKPDKPEQDKPEPEHEHSPLEGVLETVQDQEATRQRLAREKDLIDKLWELSEKEDLTGDVNLASVSEAIARNYEVIKANEKDLEGVYIKVYELSKNKALEMMLKRMENGRHLIFAKKSGWKHGEGNRFMDWVQKQKGWQGKRSAQRDMRMWENRHVVVKWIALNPNEYLNTSKADELFTTVENGKHLIFADSSGMFRKNLIDENTGKIKQEYYTAEGKLDDKKLAENRDKNISAGIDPKVEPKAVVVKNAAKIKAITSAASRILTALDTVEKSLEGLEEEQPAEEDIDAAIKDIRSAKDRCAGSCQELNRIKYAIRQSQQKAREKAERLEQRKEEVAGMDDNTFEQFKEWLQMQKKAKAKESA